MKKSFPARLLELRGEASQAVFSKKVGVLQPTYARWEQGIRRPSIDELADLAIRFGISADYLLGLTDDPTPASKRAPGGAVTVNGHGNAVANGNGNHLTQATENRFASLEARMAVIESRLAAATMKP